MTIHKTGTEENSQKYLSLREVAQLYGYTRDHLGLMIRQRKLQGVRLGNYYATTAKWMDEYIQNHADSNHPRLKNKFSNKFRAVSKTESDFNTDPVPAVSAVSSRSNFSQPAAIEIRKLSQKSIARRLEQSDAVLDAGTMNFMDLQENIEKILKNNQEIKPTSLPDEQRIVSDQNFLILPIRKMDDFERQIIISRAKQQKK